MFLKLKKLNILRLTTYKCFLIKNGILTKKIDTRDTFYFINNYEIQANICNFKMKKLNFYQKGNIIHLSNN
jgi:hypothetical protein